MLWYLFTVCRRWWICGGVCVKSLKIIILWLNFACRRLKTVPRCRLVLALLYVSYYAFYHITLCCVFVCLSHASGLSYWLNLPLELGPWSKVVVHVAIPSIHQVWWSLLICHELWCPLLATTDNPYVATAHVQFCTCAVHSFAMCRRKFFPHLRYLTLILTSPFTVQLSLGSDDN